MDPLIAEQGGAFQPEEGRSAVVLEEFEAEPADSGLLGYRATGGWGEHMAIRSWRSQWSTGKFILKGCALPRTYKQGHDWQCEGNQAAIVPDDARQLRAGWNGIGADGASSTLTNPAV